MIAFQTVSTAILRFCWFLERFAPIGSFIGSISQSYKSSEPWNCSIKGPKVACRYSVPVSLRNASIAFVGKKRNSHFYDNVSIITCEVKNINLPL